MTFVFVLAIGITLDVCYVICVGIGFLMKVSNLLTLIQKCWQIYEPVYWLYRVFGLGLYSLIYWVMYLYSDYQYIRCTSGLTFVEFLNWFIIALFLNSVYVVPAVVIGCIAVFWGPCICLALIQNYQERNQQQADSAQQTENLLKKLKHTGFNSTEQQAHAFCAICL